uniref:Uncharacterized protein n=1 Tax=Romanomermis culicivorax TaxID=13658 RepID=A0A915KE54_ROMCU
MVNFGGVQRVMGKQHRGVVYLGDEAVTAKDQEQNNVDGLLENRKAAGNLSLSLETSSAHMAETVAFRVRFSGKTFFLRASSYRGGEMSMLRITLYASKWIALTMGSLFFFWRSVLNGVPNRGYISAQSSASSKETMMVCLLLTRENSAVQSSGVAVKVLKTNIVPLGNGS